MNGPVFFEIIIQTHFMNFFNGICFGWLHCFECLDWLINHLYGIYEQNFCTGFLLAGDLAGCVVCLNETEP